MTQSSAPPEPSLLALLRAHFGADPAQLAVFEQGFDSYERANLHLALTELVQELDPTMRLVGIVVPDDYHSATLSKLSRPGTALAFDEGPVEYANVTLADDRRLACVKRGLYLLRAAGRPVALLTYEKHAAYGRGLTVEVMGADAEQAEGLLGQLTRRTRYGKALRGRVLSVEQDCYGGLQVQFHRLPSVAAADVILPAEVKRRVERHTLGFTRHAEKLRAAGRHLKRGILLHGPPGTGKTLTAMYLASQMPGRTVLIVTGSGVATLEAAARLARMLQPATMILEDVDLIGTERGHQEVGANALLFELLNQMDGLADDVDLLFVLTTNRPDVLEPALAARPGRIDQAIEVPLPDAECRRRLFELYGRGLTLQVEDWGRWIDRTAGASGAFIRELLRKATLLAAEDDETALVVRDRHIDEALAELVVAGGALTQSLLGATVRPNADT